MSANNAVRPPPGAPAARHGSLRQARKADQGQRLWPQWQVTLLLVSLFIPWMVDVGGLILRPYTLVLLLLFVPALVRWGSGRAGRVHVSDGLIVAFVIYASVSLSLAHGVQTGLKSGGLVIVETVGAYFVARAYVRSSADFRAVARLVFWVIAAMLPFLVFEMLTGEDLLMRGFSMVLETSPIADKEPRLGLHRAQGTLEHPILLGVICGAGFALTHLVLGFGSRAMRILGTVVVTLAVLTSLSSGPISSTVAQAMLIGWGMAVRIKVRWKILLIVTALAICAIEMLSERSLPQILFSAFALDKQSAFFRLLIWEFGSQSVVHHPWFGVGYGEWDRPGWMGPSIDMFWLYNAICFGLPAALMMFGAFLAALVGVGSRRGFDVQLDAWRQAYIITMVGFFLVGWTVHFWNATYVLFIFLLGSGIWMQGAGEAEPARAVRRARPALSRSRTPVRTVRPS